MKLRKPLSPIKYGECELEFSKYGDKFVCWVREYYGDNRNIVTLTGHEGKNEEEAILMACQWIDSRSV